MKNIDIYTDGSCSGNPGAGGWGAVLRFGELEKELSGGEAQTTNNRMELTAAIAALKAIKEPCKIKLYSDSQYLVKAFNEGWLEGWQKRGWKKADKSAVLNVDLWQELVELTKAHSVTFIWVKGHAENQYNNRCDKLATEQTAVYLRKNGK